MNSQNARLALYDSIQATPTNLIQDFGLISYTTAAFQEFTVSINLLPGWYFLALQLLQSNSVSAHNSSFSSVLGSLAPTSNNFNGYRANLAFGSFPKAASQASITPVITPLYWLKAS
jgi:hypothetical protein